MQTQKSIEENECEANIDQWRIVEESPEYLEKTEGEKKILFPILQEADSIELGQEVFLDASHVVSKAKKQGRKTVLALTQI